MEVYSNVDRVLSDSELESQNCSVLAVPNYPSTCYGAFVDDAARIFVFNPCSPNDIAGVSFDNIPPALTGSFGAWANWHSLPELLRILSLGAKNLKVASTESTSQTLTPNIEHLRLAFLRATEYCTTYESEAVQYRYTMHLQPANRRWVHGLMRTLVTDRLVALQLDNDMRFAVWKLTDYIETAAPDVEVVRISTALNAKHAALWREFVEAMHGTSGANANGIMPMTLVGNEKLDQTIEMCLSQAWILCDQQRIRGKQIIALRTKSNLIYAAIALRALLTAEISFHPGTELAQHHRK